MLLFVIQNPKGKNDAVYIKMLLRLRALSFIFSWSLAFYFLYLCGVRLASLGRHNEKLQ